jgi:hypothetical protein
LNIFSGRLLFHRYSALLPRQLRLVTSPAAHGLRVVRAAVWAAAILLTAVGVRGSCFALADSALTATQRWQISPHDQLQ